GRVRQGGRAHLRRGAGLARQRARRPDKPAQPRRRRRHRCCGTGAAPVPPQAARGLAKLFMLGGGPVIFNDIGNGAISVEPLKNAGILQRPVGIELKPQTKLSWRWIVEELPSRLPENQLTSHDYLSIAAEFDDGQDLTYFWRSILPIGTAFRCPIPRWTPLEFHMA